MTSNRRFEIIYILEKTKLKILINIQPTCRAILYKELHASMTLFETVVFSSVSMYDKQPIVFGRSSGSFLLERNKRVIY